MKESIFKTYGGIFEKGLLDEISNTAKIIAFKEGDALINIGQYIKSMPLLIDGVIKIMREDFDAGELLLYFLEKGDTCSMTLSCCIGEKKSEIKAIAETDGLVAMLPIQKMEEWLSRYHSRRSFVFQSYNNRFQELLNTIDNIAFMKMDERLYSYLLEKSKLSNSKTIEKTHQEIANELNSSRVVISRLLKVLEKEGKILLSRNSIQLLN